MSRKAKSSVVAMVGKGFRVQIPEEARSTKCKAPGTTYSSGALFGTECRVLSTAKRSFAAAA